jgi:hypothetical protein
VKVSLETEELQEVGDWGTVVQERYWVGHSVDCTSAVEWSPGVGAHLRWRGQERERLFPFRSGTSTQPDGHREKDRWSFPSWSTRAGGRREPEPVI